MGDAMVSEFLIALFAGMVAIATFRRNTPRAVEIVLWIGLLWACVLGVTNIHDRQARALTGAAVWGAWQMVGTLAALAEQSAMQWLVDRRFLIADWVVLLFGAGLLVGTFLVILREVAAQPRVHLGDWMELPRLASRQEPARETASAVDEINQRFKLWAPVAAAAAITWLTLLLIWTGDVVVPATGRKLRAAAPRAQMARRAAAMRVRAADWLAEVGSAPQVSWFSGLGAYPTGTDEGMDLDVRERDQRDRLAS